MDAFTIEAFALLGIGLAVIGLRTYWRLSTVGIRNLKADDYLMLLAAVVYSAETYLAYSVGKLWHGLANNGMTDDERRLLDPSSEEYRLRRLQNADSRVVDLHVPAMGPEGRHVHFLYPFDYFCQPAISKVDIFVTVVLNVVTDLYLLTIPIPMLWQSSIKPVKKAALIVMFSGGVFVTAAGVLRCVLIITNPVTGAQQAGSWAVRETFVAVITTNLPLVFPMFRIWLYPIAGTVRQYSSRALSHPSKDSRSGITGGSTKPQQPGGAFSLDDRNPRRGKGVRSVDHITGLTFSESEERLYDQNRSPTGKVPVSAETRRYSTQYPSV
ncbi:sugar transporter [Apiospora arundinis]